MKRLANICSLLTVAQVLVLLNACVRPPAETTESPEIRAEASLEGRGFDPLELRTLAEALDFLRDAGADNASLLIDTLHFHCARVPVQDLDEVPRERFGFVHLCDGPADIPSTREGIIYIARSTRRYPGEGGIDLAGIVNRMPEQVCSIELPNYIKTEIYGREGHARRCLESAKAYLAAHPR